MFKNENHKPLGNMMKSLKYTELHAHLSGSIPRQWLYNKAIEKNIKNMNLDLLNSLSPNLDECFQIFPIIHKILQSKKDLLEATEAALENFYHKDVNYLELRTTPKGVI